MGTNQFDISCRSFSGFVFLLLLVVAQRKSFVRYFENVLKYYGAVEVITEFHLIFMYFIVF